MCGVIIDRNKVIINEATGLMVLGDSEFLAHLLRLNPNIEITERFGAAI